MFDQWRTLRGGEAGFQLPTVEINTQKISKWSNLLANYFYNYFTEGSWVQNNENEHRNI